MPWQAGELTQFEIQVLQDAVNQRNGWKPDGDEGMSREEVQAMIDARKDPNWKLPDDIPRVIRADGSRVE